MASREHRSEARRPGPRLYLLTPRIADPAGHTGALAGALGAAEIAAVLLRLEAADERTLINRAKTLASSVQDHNAALLLDGYPNLAVLAGADGAHVAGIDALREAFPALKPERIVGCGGLQTRHDAMLAAESDADYVMFGEPDEHAQRPSLEAIVERVTWWAEVFEVPCVAFAANMAEIAPLAAAGADFVALGHWVFDDPRGPASAVAEAAGQLAQAEAVE
jgi:thiamine-phosphate pyrophosphorylase